MNDLPWDKLATIISSSVWPVFLLILILIFKKPLLSLISRINKGSILGNSFEATVVENQNRVQTQILKEPVKNYVEKLVGYFSEPTILTFKNAVADEIGLNGYDTDKERQDVLYNYAALLYLKLHYENIYNSIFGSQISFLQYINSINGGDTKSNLKSFYNGAVQSNTEAYEGVDYDRYLSYLFQTELVIEENDKIQITYYGKDFLKFLIEMNKNPYKSL